MGQNEPQQTSGDWKYVLAGAIVGGIIISLVFRSFVCFYVFQPTAATILTLSVSALIGVFRFIPGLIEVAAIRKAVYFLFGSLIAVIIVILIAFFSIGTFTKNYCVKDFDKLKAMIEMEGEAVLNKDINIIHDIYSIDAIISRQDTNQVFKAYEYYPNKFVTENHCTVSHSDYLVIDFSRNQVTITTSSMGTYGLKGEACNEAYSNPPGSDLWVFRKIGGEWKIVHFEFNRKVTTP